MTALAGKRAVVTGASRGIGLAVATRLEAAGAHVVRLARSLESAVSTQRTDVPCDVTDDARLGEVLERVLPAPPDILVNNAGGFLLRPLEDTEAEAFEEQVRLNLVAPFLVLRRLAPRMATVGGHVVTLGSVADHETFPGNAAYGASKFGLRALHQVLALEYRGRLRTTLVSPGPTDTTLWDPLTPDARDDLPSRDVMLRPEDVADAVLWAVTRPRHANIDVMRLSPSGMS